MILESRIPHRGSRIPSPESIVLAFVSLLVLSNGAEAQDRVYAFGGWMQVARGQAITAEVPEPGHAWVPSLSGGVGVWTDPHVGVEGSVTFMRAQSTSWVYGYQFDETGLKLTSDRDVLMTGAVRIAAVSHRKAGLDVVAGGGVSLHSATTMTTADCGPSFVHLPCTPITPVESDTLHGWEKMLSVGIDSPIFVGSHVAVAPGFRLAFTSRRFFLTGYDHRGPQSGSGGMFLFGASVFRRD